MAKSDSISEYEVMIEKEMDDLKQRIEQRHLFKENQSIVYQILNQALKENKVSHAYLFSGPAGSLKKEAGILFAQSLFLESDHLIEEESLDETSKNIARRCASFQYADFLFFDGYRNESISKDEISDIEALFSKTSAETSDRKVYMIDHIENMSIAAMNALLKFLEEPADNVYAILTTDNLASILPTIVSRCVLVPFHPLKKETYVQIARGEGLDEEDVFFLTNMIHKTQGYIDLATSETYQNAKSMLKQYINVSGNPRLLLVDYDVHYKQTVKEKNLELVTMFFKMVSLFYRSVLMSQECEIDWFKDAYLRARKTLTKETVIDLLQILQEELDLCNKTNDLNLLMDQAVYKMEALTNGRRNH